MTGIRGRPSPAGAIVGGYLLVTLPLLLRGGVAGPGSAAAGGGAAGGLPGAAAVVAAHVAALAAVVALEARRGRPGRGPVEGVLADWHPLLLLPALYAELPWLMGGAPVFHDPTVVAWERALFGGEPAFQWAGAWPWLPFSEALHLAYVSYYPLIYVPPLLLHLRGGSSPAFRRTVAALSLSMAACFLVFALWPVQGPRYLGTPEGGPEGPVRGLTLLILESGSSRGAAFPSSHVAVAVAQAWVALRVQRTVGVVVAVLTAGLALGAVYGGFHYGVDVLVGAVVGGLAGWASGPAARRFRGGDPGFTPGAERA